ncbi:MAG: hypothetical protein QOE60_989, partial [Thermoleophilaceae bacterium]|nr:hypothetical protein [Thermoleophilaceae bacterium]
SAHRPDLADSAIDAVVERALAKDPQERWQSAGALAAAAASALAAHDGPSRPVHRGMPDFDGDPTRPV